MDWIERLLHISPDGGNGSLELGLLMGAAVAAAMALAGIRKAFPRARAWFAGARTRNERRASALERFGS